MSEIRAGNPNPSMRRILGARLALTDLHSVLGQEGGEVLLARLHQHGEVAAIYHVEAQSPGLPDQVPSRQGGEGGGSGGR